MTTLDITTAALLKALGPAVVETLAMVGISAVATVLLGLPLGVVLFTTQRGAMASNPVVSFLLSGLVNITRSVPYAILMLSLIPLTKWLVGTAVGPYAATVSLTIAAVPFFARLVESALRDVHPGKIDASHAMGSTRFQTITKVLLPEAAPALVAGITTTVVTLIGYSAMAGLIGGGGLGRLGYNYGYQRFEPLVMAITVVLLMGMVQAIQALGDTVIRRVDHR